MGLIHRSLEIPTYGWERDGKLYVPTTRELWGEFFSRMRFWADRRNWIGFSTWFWVLAMTPFAWVFFAHYFSWKLLLVATFYGNFVVSTHGTIWLHRYGTHQAFRFKFRWVRFLTANLIPKTVSEEMYIISHHVHHALTELPGDPYNAHAGKLYCFLADATHQVVKRDLPRVEFEQLARLMAHTGVRLNSYEGYRRWGTLTDPLSANLAFALSWAFWWCVFSWIGGTGFALACFTGTFSWLINIRFFNFEGHGRGERRHRDGVDFHRKDLSINQLYPGLVGGEWHNNHHLFPRSARAGFLWYQLDLPWLYIRTLRALGLVDRVVDATPRFQEIRAEWALRGAPGREVHQVPERAESTIEEVVRLKGA